MKLIVIGRNPQEASIVLNSQYISNYHAEIILLDNGDMFLIDKSTNGTFLNGMRLTPGKEVAIKRGDNILFADVPLDWNLIDPIKVPKDVKVIKGVGSHYMNAINVQGSKVSRFHATIRQMADNKWYICDHSKNGTTVNNVRIQRDRFIRIKKSDEIACAGVPIQNPIPSGGFSFKWVAIVAVVACLTALAMFIPGMMKWSPEKIARTYNPAVAWVVTAYHFEVSCPGIDFDDLNNRYLPKQFIISYGKIVDYREAGPMESQGTAFFIGEDGHIVTNRHVARPWEYDNKSQYDMDNETYPLIEAAEVHYRQMITACYPSAQALTLVSQLKIKGVVDATYIIPHGSEFDKSNFISCREILVSSMNEDLAIFKVKNNVMPSNIASVPLDKISAKEMTTAKTIFTIGFPLGLDLQRYKDTPLQAYFSSGQVSAMRSLYEYGVTAMSYHGASGSPVFDEHGNVIGIIHSGVPHTQGYNSAIKAKYLVNLINQANITK